MSLSGSNNEQKIWNYLYAKVKNAYGVAGIMGNMMAESGLRPNNLQNSYEKTLGYTDDSYTAAVDNGSYTNFVYDKAGYGLVQWTYWSLKKGLYDYVKVSGKSIGDLEIQLEFLCKQLSESYSTVWNTCKTAKSVLEASNAMLLKFERPADQSSSVQAKRASYGQAFYDKYAAKSQASTTVPTTEAQLRNKVASWLKQYVGIKEGSDEHKAILAVYNNSKLCPRYTMTVNDAWCATAVSAAFIACGLAGTSGSGKLFQCVECSCQNMISKAMTQGIWVENDAYVPKVGDVIMYDWQDSGVGDNTGVADYVVAQGTSGRLTYRKWNSGISEAWYYEVLGEMPLTTAMISGVWSSSAYTGRTVNFPSGLFIDIPIAVGNIYGSAYLNLQVASAIKDMMVYRIWSPYSTTVSGGYVSIYVVGKWK